MPVVFFSALNAFVYLIAFLWARNDAFAIHHLFVHAFSFICLPHVVFPLCIVEVFSSKCTHSAVMQLVLLVFCAL